MTGGAGFIGSHFVSRVLRRYSHYHVLVLDSLTYAGSLSNLEVHFQNKRFEFVRGNVCDENMVANCVSDADVIVNFAAETHVDRSLESANEFLKTDILGVHVLLEAVKKFDIRTFLHVSTDEVYGSVDEGASLETDSFNPSSPYSASKASAELIISAYAKSFGINSLITRGSNTYGPNQYPEKLIPLFITRLLDGQTVPLYGDGLQRRDWIHVDDHCKGIDIVLHKGSPGEAYNIGGGKRVSNIEIAQRLAALTHQPDERIRFVKDRPGHDTAYSIDTSKVQALGYEPEHDFDTGLAETVEWYINHEQWWRQALERETKEGNFAARWYGNGFNAEI